MSRATSRRLIAYSCALLISGALLGAGSFLPEGEPDLGTLINGADILAKVGAHDKAIQECEKVLKRDPGNLQAHLILASSHDAESRPDEALGYYERSLEHCDLPELTLHIELAIADLQRRSGRLHEAEARLDEIESRFGASMRSRLVRGLTVAELGRREEALGLYEEAVADAPGDPLPLVYLASAHYDDGRFDRAEEAYRALAVEHDGAHEAWFHVARSRAGLQDRDGMYEALAEATARSRGLVKSQLLEDPAFLPYREDRRFEELLSELFSEAPELN